MDELVLFDIDRTLLQGHEHPETFSFAFKAVYEVNAEKDWETTQGMTDQQIIKKTLMEKGLNEEQIMSKMTQCIEEMVNYFRKTINKFSRRTAEGVGELLRELNNRNILLGLVTGNLEGIARAKLEQVGINQYFKVGGFGSDDTNRTNLVKLAIKRAERGFGFKFNNNVFLIGDSPRDIEAGKEAGVKTIGVTTGVYSEEQLEEAGADFVIKNFKDKNKILGIIFK